MRNVPIFLIQDISRKIPLNRTSSTGKERTKRPPRPQKRKYCNENDGICDKDQMVAAKNRKRNEDLLNRVWEYRQGKPRPRRDPIPDPIG